MEEISLDKLLTGILHEPKQATGKETVKTLESFHNQNIQRIRDEKDQLRDLQIQLKKL